jgi:translocator protein
MRQVVWTTIGLLRTVSSSLVYEAVGRNLLAAPIIVMMLHLSIGDT